MCSVEDDLQITASRGVKLVGDRSIAECTEQTYDLVVLPVSVPHALSSVNSIWLGWYLWIGAVE